MKELLAKLSSRKLGVAAVAGVTAATGVVELTWPIAAVACAYIISQAFVDAHEA